MFRKIEECPENRRYYCEFFMNSFIGNMATREDLLAKRISFVVSLLNSIIINLKTLNYV